MLIELQLNEGIAQDRVQKSKKTYTQSDTQDSQQWENIYPAYINRICLQKTQNSNNGRLTFIIESASCLE